MSLISVNNLTCAQATKVLFEKATFSVEDTDKIALIGINGSGKSTLLSRLTTANTTPDDAITMRNGLRMTSLPQNPDFNPDHTVLDHLYRSSSLASQAVRDYQERLHLYHQNHSPNTEKALALASEKMDHLNAWEYENRVSSILRELDITNMDQKIGDLSGGMRKKISLAQTFFEETDLLILDEPTNHLDITTIEWLEEMLKRQKCALLMVTHDRYFLDKVCTKIIEIDQHQIFVTHGNYQTYLEQRDQRYRSAARQESRVQSILRVELEWLKRGPKARSTKQKARKDRIATLMAQKGISAQETLSLNVESRRLGKKILELKHISKSFGEKHLITDFSYTFTKGDILGILGPNGVGKTTLLNIITERIPADSGVVDIGINTVFGYFDQHSQDFDPEMTIYEHVSAIGTQFTNPDGSKVSAAKLLERFLFPSGMLNTAIGKLSGGERRRLHLVCLLLKNPNFLVFDEPTNDLDIHTLSVLEDFLISFAGCVIIISHDRYFMDRVVDHLLVFNPGGKIATFLGNYTDYMDTLADIKSLSQKSARSNASAPTPPQAPQKLSYREKEEMTQLETKIDTLEAEKETLSTIFSAPDKTAADYEEAGKRLKTVTGQLDHLMARWEELAERDG